MIGSRPKLTQTPAAIFGESPYSWGTADDGISVIYRNNYKSNPNKKQNDQEKKHAITSFCFFYSWNNNTFVELKQTERSREKKSDGTKATSERLKPNRNNKNQMGREEEKNTKTKWFYVCKMFNFSQHLDMFIRIGHQRRALRYGIDENILWFISS